MQRLPCNDAIARQTFGVFIIARSGVMTEALALLVDTPECKTEPLTSARHN
jgi:hypothetical protein